MTLSIANIPKRKKAGPLPVVDAARDYLFDLTNDNPRAVKALFYVVKQLSYVMHFCICFLRADGMLI